MSLIYKVIILTYNAGNFLENQSDKLINIMRVSAEDILIIDSSSTDNSLSIIKKYCISHKVINKSDFDHGATRQLGVDLIDSDIYIFMTQDAIPVDENTIKNIIKAFDDPKVGCAYGRQLPYKEANLLSRHARSFNYSKESYVRSYEDRYVHGIKTCFNSNSFAAYRKTALTEVSGFPSRNILGEDMFVAAKMLQAGWKIAYCADAKVYHSHNYTLAQEFKRYFDIGVFHTEQSWILEAFKPPSKEGFKYVKSELRYCWNQQAYLQIIKSLLTVGLKLIGYKLGKLHHKIPLPLKRKISMCSFYWK
jgi:rhamnosyltransferase